MKSNFVLHIRKHIVPIITNKWLLTLAFVLACFFVTWQSIHLGPKDFWNGTYTHYNNYVIFKYGYPHLVENLNLYLYYPKEYADLYKYSPSFALFMAPFYWLPDTVGLFLWTALNIFVPVYAIFTIPKLSNEFKGFLLLCMATEIILSVQNEQSNGLLAGLTILAFNMLERGKPNYAALFIVLGAYIKIYSLLGCLLFLFYPGKLKAAWSFVVYGLVLFLLPIIVIDYSDLIQQYKNWYVLLKNDENASIGMSLLLYVNEFSSSPMAKKATMLFGLVLLSTPLIYYKKYTNYQFRVNYLAFVLIWMVVFNHKAESPTFVIAMAGVGIWFLNSGRKGYQFLLFIGSMLFTSLWFTDLIPAQFKNGLVDHNYVKQFFPILCLFAIYIELLGMKQTELIKTEKA